MEAEPRFPWLLRDVGYQPTWRRWQLRPYLNEDPPMSLWTPGGGDGPPEQPRLTPEQELEAEQIANEMAQVREQLSQVPAAQVVANHAMGCWELAAIHLSAQPPKFDQAQVAIDAFAALIDVIDGKLGDDEATLKDALAQLRLAFVQVKASYEGGAADSAAAPAPATEPSDPAEA